MKPSKLHDPIGYAEWHSARDVGFFVKVGLFILFVAWIGGCFGK